jgi:flagellar motor switch protein FliN/FliY
LVKSSADEREGEDLCARSSPLTRIPIEIDVAVPVRGFRVANLLALEKNHVIASQWQQGEDLPLGSRGAQLAWAEFEVIDDKLAVRITRLV